MKKKVFNADGILLSIQFYTKTRIAASIQHENETLEVAREMQEITQQKPILCLESHTRLFRSALDSILEAYSEGEYSDEDLRKGVLTSMKLICLWLEMWKETTFVTQSTGRGLGSAQAS